MPNFRDTKNSDDYIERTAEFPSTDDLNYWRKIMPYPIPSTHQFTYEYLPNPNNKNPGALPICKFGVKRKDLRVIAQETNNFETLTLIELRAVCKQYGITLSKPGLGEDGRMIKQDEKTAMLEGVREYYKSTVSFGEKSYSPPDEAKIVVIPPEIEALTEEQLETKAAHLRLAGPFQRLKNRRAGRPEKLLFIARALAKRESNKEPVEV